MKEKRPPVEGTALLSMAGFSQEVAFSLEHPGGQQGGKGAIAGPPEAMRAAFKAGYVSVILPGGRRLRLHVIAHSEGGDRAYVQFTEPLADLLPATPA